MRTLRNPDYKVVKEAVLGLTLCDISALKILRVIRCEGAAGEMLMTPCQIAHPLPMNGMNRWGKGSVDLTRFGAAGAFSPDQPLCVAVPSKRERLRTQWARNVICMRSYPKPPAIELGQGISIVCPELLFMQLAGSFSLPALVMLGYELTGTFSRDALDPRDGEARLWVEPVTTVQRIRSFIEACPRARNSQIALEALSCVTDNAWSPAEAVLVTVLSLPSVSGGYGLGPLSLNPRIKVGEDAFGMRRAKTRVPDMVFAGTDIGLNYEGENHLDLDSLVRSVMDAALNPGSLTASEVFESTKRSVRAKAVDDGRRDRELMLSGLNVLRVTKEDLLERGGMERLVALLLLVIERQRGVSYDDLRASMGIPALVRARQRLVWSLLPGAIGRAYGHVEAMRQRLRLEHAKESARRATLVCAPMPSA